MFLVCKRRSIYLVSFQPNICLPKTTVARYYKNKQQQQHLSKQKHLELPLPIATVAGTKLTLRLHVHRFVFFESFAKKSVKLGIINNSKCSSSNSSSSSSKKTSSATASINDMSYCSSKSSSNNIDNSIIRIESDSLCHDCVLQRLPGLPDP